MGDAYGNGAGWRPDGGLGGLLDELVDRVPGVRYAVLLSAAGPEIGSSRGLSRADARRLASVAAGFHRVATDAGRRLGAGSGRRTMVELEAGGWLFVAAAGRDACLAVLGTGEADPGVVAAETERLAGRLGGVRRPGPPPSPVPPGTAG
ncbi:roadblock/LC7 domain-containing protein [Streptomyces sp. F63]|uniref:roadblock/LC7 domain-containing protein n=1 Tax=Streptomyces sp. F63 TaxID=2824887 RepID=UPI001B390788|nr:roadblock/LC7 domain-containing protein [Streptomyces sp. F63]MBQ0985694.1 roadblock/LC7 domain-containing protein [Streptomyces sp. F63]